MTIWNQNAALVASRPKAWLRAAENAVLSQLEVRLLLCLAAWRSSEVSSVDVVRGQRASLTQAAIDLERLHAHPVGRAALLED